MGLILKSQVKCFNHLLNQEKYRLKLEKIRQNLKAKKRIYGKKKRKKARSTRKWIKNLVKKQNKF